MVDWATRDRLYPSGYHATDVRYRRTTIDSSLPYSLAINQRHDCRIRTKRKTRSNENEILVQSLRHGLNHARRFYDQNSIDVDDHRQPKLLASYISNINWARSVCCLSGSDGSLIVCEQDRCRLLLFTPILMLRSTCGGKRGRGSYEFDSPWSVASLIDHSILVADTNNQRIQIFSIGYNDRFLFKDSLITKQKPFYLATSNVYFAVSCEKGLIISYLAKERIQVSSIDLNKTSFIKKTIDVALPICMDTESSFLFIGNSVSTVTSIYQLSITGEYLRSIEFDHYPFLRISSMIFDNSDQQLIIADGFNSIIYSVDPDIDEDNIEILFKRSDSVNCPQGLCIGNEGHLIVVECSVTTQHSMKIFHFHPCICHSRVPTASLKTSETTSVRSMIFSYDAK